MWIALALGEEGAAVYVTGRSTRTGSRTMDRSGELAQIYGFTDIDGRQIPPYVTE